MVGLLVLGAKLESRPLIILDGVLLIAAAGAIITNWRGVGDSLRAPWRIGRFRTRERPKWEAVFLGITMLLIGIGVTLGGFLAEW